MKYEVILEWKKSTKIWLYKMRKIIRILKKLMRNKNSKQIK